LAGNGFSLLPGEGVGRSTLGLHTVAEGIAAWNPVFDVTPGELIDAIVTERGVARPPFEQSLKELAAAAVSFFTV